MSTVDMSKLIDQQEEKADVFSKTVRRIELGDIFWCNLGDVTEQYNKYMIKKCRPCIILSPDSDDRTKNVFSILPIKTFRGDEYDNGYNVVRKIILGDIESLLCLDQIRPINRRSIQEYIGTLTVEQKQQVDDHVQDFYKMNGKFAELNKIMDIYGLSMEDVIQIVLSTVSTGDDEEPEDKSCRPFDLSNVQMK